MIHKQIEYLAIAEDHSPTHWQTPQPDFAQKLEMHKQPERDLCVLIIGGCCLHSATDKYL